MKTMPISASELLQSTPRPIKSFFNSGFDFQIPQKYPDNGFLGDLGLSDFNDAIEYVSPSIEISPGIYNTDKRESSEDYEQNTFSLCINSYGDDLYEITITDGNRDKKLYQPDTYPEELFQFLYSIEEKRGIEFPLTSEYNANIFKNNSIILDKKQLFEFIQDMKIEEAEIFKSGEYAQATPSDEVKKTGDNSYEMINVLPTDFYDNGTFSPKEFDLSDSDNARIYFTGLSQTLSGDILSKLNLKEFIDEIEFIIMPDDYVQIQFRYKKNIYDKMTTGKNTQLMLEIAEIIGGYKYSEFFYNRFGNITEFLQKNLSNQIDLSKKRKITLPLSKALGLESDTYSKVIIPLEQLDDFIKDFKIRESIIQPTKNANKKLKPLLCEGYRKELLENIKKINNLSLDNHARAGIIKAMLEIEQDENPRYRIEKEKLSRKRKFWLFNKQAEQEGENIEGMDNSVQAQEAFQMFSEITNTDIKEIKRVWGNYYGKGDRYDMIGNGLGSLISAVKLMLEKSPRYKNKLHINIGFTQDQMEFLEKIFKDILEERKSDIYLLLDEMFDIKNI